MVVYAAIILPICAAVPDGGVHAAVAVEQKGPEPISTSLPLLLAGLHLLQTRPSAHAAALYRP